MSPPDPRTALVALHDQTRRRVEVLLAQIEEFVSASRDTNADDEHDPEGATIAYERAQTATLLREAERSLADVADALRRLDADPAGYGRCEVCGEAIPVERLAVRPAARTCVPCGEHAGRRGR